MEMSRVSCKTSILGNYDVKSMFKVTGFINATYLLLIIVLHILQFCGFAFFVQLPQVRMLLFSLQFSLQFSVGCIGSKIYHLHRTVLCLMPSWKHAHRKWHQCHDINSFNIFIIDDALSIFYKDRYYETRNISVMTPFEKYMLFRTCSLPYVIDTVLHHSHMYFCFTFMSDYQKIGMSVWNFNMLITYGSF